MSRCTLLEDIDLDDEGDRACPEESGRRLASALMRKTAEN